LNRSRKLEIKLEKWREYCFLDLPICSSWSWSNFRK